MKYKYEVCCVAKLVFPCSKCSRAFHSFKDFWDNYIYKALWYVVDSKIYCYYCLEHLEQTDPDWSLGVYANG